MATEIANIYWVLLGAHIISPAATIIVIIFTDKKSEACRRQNDLSRRQVWS